ncbi:MAG: type IV secretory system conjugative DNA transfer family protein, partial [Acidobacteria bacterium]|nr:type IV secretory system conjugative DNA transfer family protein [Acidobacteriota bacterium]
LIDMADVTYSGVMSNVSEATKFLSDPQIKTATATSSFSMRDLATAFTTVYLVIPPERMDTQRTWLRLVLTAAMQTFKRGMPEDKRCSRCMFLIDEFPALGRMEDIPRDIATMSGYGLDFTLIIQGLDQLEAIYGEASGTILNNCSYKWFCNVSDLKTAKYVSETLGQTTVATVGKSTSTGQNRGGASVGESTNFGETGKPLLRSEESSTSAKTRPFWSGIVR